MNTLKYLFNSYIPLIFPITGFIIGAYLDRYDDLRLVKFRDKSALYGRELAPGEQPSWP